MDPHLSIPEQLFNLRPMLLAANPQGLTILAVILLFLLIISFFVSGAEVALFSLTGKDLNNLKTKTHASARRILSLLEQPRVLHASLLITNLFVNLGIIIVSNIVIDEMQLFTNLNFWIELSVKIVSVSFLLLLFGEVLPRVWAAQNNIRFAYQSSLLVEVIHALFRGVSGWAVEVATRMEKGLGSKRTDLDLEEDIGESAGSTEEEKQMLKGIMKFGNITVRQVMRTRLDVSGIEYNTSFPELIRKVEEWHYSRLPVYKGSLDEVTGMIHTKDLLPYIHQSETFDWHSLMRPPYFVHEQKLIEDLLQEFRSRGIHFAIVVDEFGGTEGIVTLEDIMEEIIGEIKDEFDEEESSNNKIDDYNYVFEGKTGIAEACRIMHLPVDTFDEVRGNSESLAGLVLEIAGMIPVVDQVVPCGDFDFRVMEVSRNRIQRVQVTIKPRLD